MGYAGISSTEKGSGYGQTRLRNMSETPDTYMRISYDEALEIFKDMGFEEVLSDVIHRDENKSDMFKVFWLDGILLTAGSYNSLRENPETGKYDIEHVTLDHCHIYYNWVPDTLETDPKTGRSYWDSISSGGFTVFRDGEELPLRIDTRDDDEFIWAGNHDTRYGLRYKIAALKENGTILPKWRADANPWLVASHEAHGVDHKEWSEIKKERIARLPEHVRNAIKGNG